MLTSQKWKKKHQGVPIHFENLALVQLFVSLSIKRQIHVLRFSDSLHSLFQFCCENAGTGFYNTIEPSLSQPALSFSNTHQLCSYFFRVCLTGVNFEFDEGVPGLSPTGLCGVDLAGDDGSV